MTLRRVLSGKLRPEPFPKVATAALFFYIGSARKGPDCSFSWPGAFSEIPPFQTTPSIYRPDRMGTHFQTSFWFCRLPGSTLVPPYQPV